MAGRGPGPPENFGKKEFKCHPRQKLNVVICILRENVYHTKHFQKLDGNTKTISQVCVICNEYEDVNVTSSLEACEYSLNNDARLIIANIKTS